ncbi:MAG: PKD domain-containing protein [Methanolinea sp.]|nr:PKD domain-containing protein [Methanolinea sp.]
MDEAWRHNDICRRFSIVFLLALTFSCAHATALTVSAGDCTIAAPGEVGECAIMLDEVTLGFSEFEVMVKIEEPGMGTITAVQFPAFARLTSRSKVPAGAVTIKGADTGNRVRNGDRNVLLATLNIRGEAAGTCSILVTVLGLKDENGSPYVIPGKNGRLVVLSSPSPLHDPQASGTVQDALEQMAPTHPDTLPPGGSSGPDSGIPGAPGDPGTGQEEAIPTVTSTAVPGPAPPLPSETPPPPVPTPTPAAPPDTLPGQVLQEPGVTENSPSPSPSGTPADSPLPSPTGENPSPGPGQGDMCTLCLSSDPPSARLVIDGIERGKTPLCVPLLPGTHLVSLSAEGYVSREFEVTTGGAQTLSLPVFFLRRIPTWVLTAGCGPGGTVSPQGSIQVRGGEMAEFLFMPDRGYELVDVLVDGESTGPTSPLVFSAVSSNHEVYGIFAPVPPPVANFTANTTGGPVPLAVQFDDRSTGNISGRLWDFGDGTSSTDTSPVHVYRQDGTYTVTLEVCGEGGCNLSVIPCTIIVGGEGISPTDNTSTPAGDTEDTGEPVSGGEEPLIIGGSKGYIEVRCPVEGARVSLDGKEWAEIRNGTCTIPLYLTGTPCRFITVRAFGYLPLSVPLAEYPAEGETLVIEVALQRFPGRDPLPSFFKVPVRIANVPAESPTTLV